MAASMQREWLKQIRIPIQSMTDVVTAIAATSSHNSSQHAHITRMQSLRASLLKAICHPLHHPPEQSALTIRTEHELFITDVVLLMTALEPQLDRLGRILSLVGTSSSIGTAGETVFWELWKLLVAGCEALEIVADQWPTLSQDQQPSNMPLHNAFDAILAWLLLMSRSSAWLAMQPRHGCRCRNADLLTILLQPTRCLAHLTVGTPAVATSHLSFFPPNLLSVLCCIFSEQFSHSPLVAPPATQSPPPCAGVRAADRRATMYRQGLLTPFRPCFLHHFCYRVTSVMNNMLAIRACGGSTETIFRLLTAPAVVHFLKGNFLLPCETPSSAPDLIPYSTPVLHTILSLILQTSQKNTGPMLSIQDRVANRDAAGLPVHLNPFLSQQALETDSRLLHVCSTHPVNGSAYIWRGLCGIRVQTLRIWLLAGRLYPAPEAAVACMIKSAVGLAKHIALYGLHVVQQEMQAGPANNRHPRQLVAAVHGRQQQLHQQQEQQQHPQHGAAQPRVFGLPEPIDSEGLIQLRCLLLLTSNFEMSSIGGSFHQTTGAQVIQCALVVVKRRG